LKIQLGRNKLDQPEQVSGLGTEGHKCRRLHRPNRRFGVFQ